MKQFIKKHASWLTLIVLTIAVNLTFGMRYPLPRPADPVIELGTTNFTDLEAEDITATDDLVVTDDASVGGDLAVTGDASVGGDLAITGSLTAQSPYAAKAASYTLLTTDTGGLFSNGGASTGITFTLPTAAAGLQYTFYTSSTQIITVTPSSGDMILHLTNAVDDRINNATAGDSLNLVAIDTLYWVPLSETGTWGDSN